MILILTHKIDLSSDLVIRELKSRNHNVVRVNLEDYPLEISLTYYPHKPDPPILKVYGKLVDLSCVGSVWYRVPFEFSVRRWAQDYQLTRFIEASCNHIWYPLELVLDCFWMNKPLAVRNASYKIFQLKIAKEIGFDIPCTCITNDDIAARNFYSDIDKSMAVKTICGGAIHTPENVYAVFTNPVSEQAFSHIGSIQKCPCQLQEYVQKSLEMRVIVVQEKTFAVEIHSQNSDRSKHDWRHYDFDNVKHEVHHLPDKIRNLCVQLTQKLNLVFGAIDLILTPDGRYVFLEVNPTGQYGWLEDFTQLPITETIVETLIFKDS